MCSICVDYTIQLIDAMIPLIDVAIQLIGAMIPLIDAVIPSGNYLIGKP